ncbi:phosphoenolpyruvate--protein phosphotransferase [Moorellaceae bacterium AZ2]
MIKLTGIAASPGIAIGRAFILRELNLKPSSSTIDPQEVEGELARTREAFRASRTQLEAIRGRVVAQMGEKKAAIFDAHLMLLDDPVLVKQVERLIREDHRHPSSAIAQVVEEYAAVFEGMEDTYLRERAVDIRDIGWRLLANLAGLELSTLADLYEPSIVVAHDLTPSDIAQASKDLVLGFATDVGGRTSHTAIIARSLGIPAVVGLDRLTSQVTPGDLLVVDGVEGVVILRPSEEILKEYRARQERFSAVQQELRALRALPTQTVDGHRVEVAANIGNAEEVMHALHWGAEGVGLFRTEFLFMNRNRLPGEEEQYQAYRAAAEAMKPGIVTIRTLDLGGDKHIPSLNIPREANPFLGWRAIRISLECRDLFRDQLRAIFRAAAYGRVRVMFPMIATREELLHCKEVVEEVKRELAAKGVPYDPSVQVGIMVETPAAAVAADILAPEVDFFSIGTNDLIQYTLAVDRMNEKVAYLYDPFNPSVLRLIKHVVEAGHAHGCIVGMCGEMAGEPLAIPLLLGLGLDEFSMSPSSIPLAKKIIRSLTMTEAKEIAKKVLSFRSSHESREYLKAVLERITT